MSNAISLINQFPSTKKEQKYFVDKAVGEVLSGDYNPLDVEIYLKAFENISSEIRKQIKEATIKEAQKHGAKTFEYRDAEVTIGEYGTKYDYTQCCDSEYNQLAAEIKCLTEKLKEREKFLKNIPVLGLDFIDANSGEIKKIYPPLKTSTTSVAIKF
jgi:hypothetical protein